MSDPLLSSLCSICHIRPQKYRCPRCFILTCSLPCVKRHKQWAQCNGLRDTAKYIRREDLATPRAIDHDYNYLTSIEREFDRAEREAIARGTFVVTGKRNFPRKGKKMLSHAIEKREVMMARAPKGMSRSKQNHTQWSKIDDHLSWTVEWIHPDGQKEYRSCSELEPLCGKYPGAQKYSTSDQHVQKKARIEKKTNIDRQTSVAPAEANRRLSKAPESDSNYASNQAMKVTDPLIQDKQHQMTSERDSTPTATSSNSKGQWMTAAETSNKGAVEISIEKSDTRPFEENKLALLRERALNTMRSAKRQSAEDTAEDGVENLPGGLSKSDRDLESMPPPPLPSEIGVENHLDLAFYLHAPSLPSQYTVLIPLSPKARLIDCLRNRLVLEFPTVHVLRQSSTDPLPTGLITEEQFYLMSRRESIEAMPSFATLPGKSNGSGDIRNDKDMEEGEVDERTLVEVLGKDLRNVGAIL